MFCSQCGTKNSQEAKFCANCGKSISLASESVQGYSAFSVSTPQFAGFWLRALALFIDSILCQVASFFIVFPLAFALGASMASTASLSEIEAAGEMLGFVLGLLIHWLWFTVSESSQWQATLGKKMLGLKVTDENGERIGFGKANGRYWSKILSGLILCIGFLMAAITAKKQGLHDLIAGTLVIKADT